MKENKMNNKGFSLVELIVVIAIMAILVGALAPQFLKYVEKSRQATDLQTVSEMKSAIEVFAADYEGSATSATISVTSTGISFDASAAANAGLQSSVSTKSSGWPAGSFTYSLSSYSWTAGACSNSKAPGYDLQSVFN